MRLILPLLALTALAACEKPAAPPDVQPGVTANISDQTVPEAPPPPPPANAASPAEADATLAEGAQTGPMPVAVQGRWTGLNDRCGDRAADLELNILPDRLVFHESVGTVEDVTPAEDAQLSVKAAFTGEGQSWTRTLALSPSADGQRLTIVNDGAAVTRKRC